MSRFDNCLQKLAIPGGASDIHFYSLKALEQAGLTRLDRLPFSIKVLVEMMLRLQASGNSAYTEQHVTALAAWSPKTQAQDEFPFLPSRVLLQDFTGVPCLVDLAAMRSALQKMGRDPARIEPQIPVDLVIDHSVQIDAAGSAAAYQENLDLEFSRNGERYRFLRWGQQAFKTFRVLPPGLGICHQVNMEHLAHCVSVVNVAGRRVAIPDTLVGTDSHTTMINSMGIVGWGVGGIEAEAAMLNQPIPILTPKVIGCRLTGRLGTGCTPTDAALAVTQTLRAKGVVECFVEYFGDGLDSLSVADRAPLANMSPEYGATIGLFPVDRLTLEYLRQTGRPEEQVRLVEAYCRAQGLFREAGAPEPEFTDVVTIDLSAIKPSVAGPKRPQDRIELTSLKKTFAQSLRDPTDKRGFGIAADRLGATASAGALGELRHGSVVIAAITSCTNTSNPTLMIGAGILARNAAKAGLAVPPYVKTSFAPGSRAVTEYLERAGLIPHLNNVGFNIVAYGCTTCIGNSGPLRPEIDEAITRGELVAAAVLSGNRNFEGRIHPNTRANFLCSPPLVVAFALAGRVDIDFETEPIGAGKGGKPVFLRDIWPAADEISALLKEASRPEIYSQVYANVLDSNPVWSALSVKSGAVYAFESDSTYIREPPFFAGFNPAPGATGDIEKARVLGLFGDFITTDHISPAGSISSKSPAARYLNEHGVQNRDFNSYGARRGNHEVMMRGTFANIRIRNLLMDKEGGNTIHHPTGETLPIYDAAERYRKEGTPLLVIAGKLYGAGSSRDWAAKGTLLLGVKAVLAENFERIHRSNLAGMGVLPLEFLPGQTAQSLGLKGTETYAVRGIGEGLRPGKILTVVVSDASGERSFQARCRLDTALEIEYYRHGGILPYVLGTTMK